MPVFGVISFCVCIYNIANEKQKASLKNFYPTSSRVCTHFFYKVKDFLKNILSNSPLFNVFYNYFLPVLWLIFLFSWHCLSQSICFKFLFQLFLHINSPLFRFIRLFICSFAQTILILSLSATQKSWFLLVSRCFFPFCPLFFE